LRPEGLGVGRRVLGEAPPPHHLGDLGSTISSPSRVWGRAPAEIEFGAFGFKI